MTFSSTSAEISDLPVFYIGHHDDQLDIPVTEELLHHAEDCGYDMITAPITTDAFRSRVSRVVDEYLKTSEQTQASGLARYDAPFPVLGNIDCSNPDSPETNLRPTSFLPTLILTASPWIDLASPDPLIADISRQVLILEVQYASFCGASNVLVQGPHLRRSESSQSGSQKGHDKANDNDDSKNDTTDSAAGLSLYARAIQEALDASPFISISIALPLRSASRRINPGNNGQTGDETGLDVSDTSGLACYARPQYRTGGNISNAGPTNPTTTSKTNAQKQTENNAESSNSSADDNDELESWDAWNFIRSTCTYHNRLSVALTFPRQLPSAQVMSRWYCEPVRILLMSSKIFSNGNENGNVTLSKMQQLLLFRYMRMRQTPWIVLKDIGKLPDDDPRQEENPFTFGSASDPTPAEAASGKKVKTHESSAPAAPYITDGAHVLCLRQLQEKQPARDAIDRFCAGYHDYLQNPLQPLTDNLESMTYEVFEKDPIKYEWYERAIEAALRDWSRRGKQGSGHDGSIVIAVVGAGRGPLVTRALKATKSTDAKTDVWAVEKNQNAFALLQRHFSEKWSGRVNLARSDMRSWRGPFHMDTASTKVYYPVDILVSELLGSFGDNELSPECLDGVINLLNPEGGLSIPSSYTAHLTPISAPKLHADIQARAVAGDAEAAQIPYVVMLDAVDYLSAINAEGTTGSTAYSRNAGDAGIRNRMINSLKQHHFGKLPVVLQAWEFNHQPNQKQRFDGNGNEHNRRFARLDFHCRSRGVCNGLGGYFETVLFDSEDHRAGSDEQNSSSTVSSAAAAAAVAAQQKVELSTNPMTMDAKSRDMISWFPIYFPLKDPLYFPDNSILSVSIWRQTDGRKVWYEWMIESFMLVSSGGRSRRIRLSATNKHSSLKNACLM